MHYEEKEDFVMTTREKALAAVHAAAATGALTVAALPIGLDAIALRGEEIAAIALIGSFYGAKLSKATASGLMASGFAQMVGEKAALAALEASHATGFGAYVIKAGIATALIEAVGRCAADYFEEAAAA